MRGPTSTLTPLYTMLSSEEVTRRAIAIVGPKPNQNPYVCYYCGSELRGYYGAAEEKLGVRPLCPKHGFVRPVYGDLTDEYEMLSLEQTISMYYGADDGATLNDVKARIEVEEDWQRRYDLVVRAVIREERESRGIFEGRDQA